MSLPDEIWIKIFQYVGHRGLRNVQLTSRKFRNIAQDEQLWASMLKRKYVALSSSEPSKKKFATRYKRIKWDNSSNEFIQEQLKSICATYKRYSCSEPHPGVLFMLICNQQDDDFGIDTEAAAPNDLSEPLTADILLVLSLTAVVFFAENFPDMLTPHLFTKRKIWQANDLLGILLWASGDRKKIVSRLAKRAVDAVFSHFDKDVLRRHISRSDLYRMTTTDGTEEFTSSCFRRLIYDGRHEAIGMIVRSLGREAFLPEITRVDEIDYTVLNELTAEKPNRGAIDTATLDILYVHFASELHALVNQHITSKVAPNCLMSIADTTNIGYIKHFFRYFRREGQRFVEWCERDNNLELENTENHGFHSVYAFAKAWCL